MTEGTSNSLFTHNVPLSFTITLVSSASMNVFKDNTLANFKNLLSEEINLQGEWRVAVTEITFPTQINNVTDNNIVYYKKDRVIASMKVEKDKISRPYLGETAKITKGEYTSIDQILDEIRRKTELEKLDYVIDPITKHLSLWLHYWEGITFSSPQIPSLLGFKGVRDGTGYHIGYKQGSTKHSTFSTQDLIADYPVDVCAGTQLMFIYLDIIHYQIVGDTKAPLLRVIDTNRRVKNGYACTIEPNHRKVFSNLDLKKLLVNNISNISVNLRTETGGLVPFAGEGKVVLTLKFQKLSN